MLLTVLNNLKIVGTLSQKEFAKVYETVLRSPGMEDVVKIDLRIKRKDILFLSQMVERGLVDPGAGGLFSDESVEWLKTTVSDILEKGKLKEFNEGLKELIGNKV